MFDLEDDKAIFWLELRRRFSVDEDFYLLAFVRAQLLTSRKRKKPPTSKLLTVHTWLLPRILALGV
jgi:hypothetical protein